MAIASVHSNKKLIAQIVLLGFPTILLAFYFLFTANGYYEVLQNKWQVQGLVFGVGCIASLTFYSYRFRFITTVAFLLLIMILLYWILNRMVVGEFETPLLAINFRIFATLFFLGWMAGWGFSRSRYFTIAWSVVLLALQLLMVSKMDNISAKAIILSFVPILVYAFYIIYTAELIRNMNEDEKGFGWFITKRLLGFGVVIGLMLLVIFTSFNKEFYAIEKDWGGANSKQDKDGKQESMTRENKDGTISNKETMQVTSSLQRGKNRLVFVARLDNYMPDGVTPNPLYFTTYYYTKFDTLTQTFEVDSLMPKNDLFRPDPSKIPLYFAKTDSSVITNTMATLKRKVVNADIYTVNLSPSEYLAPSTAFFCQPIAVDKDFKDQYRSAYRAKMWVSELNSAYFVYNPAGNYSLEDFQQQRFGELRTVTNYDQLDQQFMNYYTFMPDNEEYKRIRELALQITKDAKTPVDKMIAIRNYFLGKDEYGQPLFKYSDNPGIPGLPSASKLNYFLFENRKGYCAYYAGATLFLLRSLGIPSRIAAGFLTIDRSTKNPGWYWFYEDQAHAWVQLYFPGYGWMDFDTTVPDEEAQQSPQPDQTPPLNMQQAYFVANGKVESIDTVKKMMQLHVDKILYHDKELNPAEPTSLMMDLSVASITRDSGIVRMGELRKGMDVVAVSYAEAIKNLPPAPSDNFKSIINKIPKPVPTDEVRIMDPGAKKQAQKAKDQEEKSLGWWQIMWISIGVLAGFVFLLFATPSLIWVFLHNRAKREAHPRTKAYRVHRAGMYYLNQLGYERTNTSPADYANNIDQRFGTSFASFNNIYQKTKYSTQPLSEKEATIVNQFYLPFIQRVKQQVPFKKRFSRFLNLYNTIHFFTQPKINR
jgi:protein-glutamine gamma-glutamyltransferase